MEAAPDEEIVAALRRQSRIRFEPASGSYMNHPTIVRFLAQIASDQALELRRKPSGSRPHQPSKALDRVEGRTQPHRRSR